jgi:hypothetical protein
MLAFHLAPPDACVTNHPLNLELAWMVAILSIGRKPDAR